jgi:hypothetical protein
MTGFQASASEAPVPAYDFGSQGCRFEPCRVQIKCQSRYKGDSRDQKNEPQKRCYLVFRFYSSWFPLLSASKITLTQKKNASRVAEYAELVGWTTERLVNHLLAQKLDEFDDVGAGISEGFLGSIDYDNPKSAERALARVARIARKQAQGGHLPKSFKAKCDPIPTAPSA